VLAWPKARSTTVSKAIDDLFAAVRLLTDTRPRVFFQRTRWADLAEMIGFAHLAGFTPAVGELVLALVATTPRDGPCKIATSEHAPFPKRWFFNQPGASFALVVARKLVFGPASAEESVSSAAKFWRSQSGILNRRGSG